MGEQYRHAFIIPSDCGDLSCAISLENGNQVKFQAFLKPDQSSQDITIPKLFEVKKILLPAFQASQDAQKFSHLNPHLLLETNPLRELSGEWKTIIYNLTLRLNSVGSFSFKSGQISTSMNDTHTFNSDDTRTTPPSGTMRR